MSANVETLKLTPLDLIIPTYLYFRLALSFKTKETIDCLLPKLQASLNATCHNLPWVGGKVFYATQSPTAKKDLEVRWQANDCPIIVDLGTLSGSYEDAAGSRMPLTTIPGDKWPKDALITEQLHSTGVPVFAAGVLSFAASGGVILCICIHHNVVDAGGLAEVLRIWTDVINGAPASEVIPDARNDRLSAALASDLESASSTPIESLLQLHPEYTTGPPQLGPDVGRCSSAVLTVSLSKVDHLKAKVGKHTSVLPTTNTIISAVLWCAITRLRRLREPTLFPLESKSRLVMAVNGRARISPDFSTVKEPYFGNLVVHALAELPTDLLSGPDNVSNDSLAQVCDAIVDSLNSPNEIDAVHVAEVCSLVSRLDEPLTPDRTFFGGLDMAITSWANLSIYDMSFGDSLGHPEFVRVPYTEIDSSAIILPRKRSSAAVQSGDVIEMVVMLRKDDYESLKADEVWDLLADDQFTAT